MHDTSEPSRIEPPLTPELLVSAYAQGWFPMADTDTGEILWYSPDPRAVIPLDAFHVPKSLGRVVRARKFVIRTDTSFEAVIRACAQPRAHDTGVWIDDRIEAAYNKLHELGVAHSVEAWLDGALVGGLYGVALGGAFFGESMFSRPELGGSNASKVCLVHLVSMLRQQRFNLLDTQFVNDHIVQFGCIEIPRSTYLERLRQAIRMPCQWGSVSTQEVV